MSEIHHILLTGGTGFFGRALLRGWQSKAFQGLPVPLVTVLSRSPERFLQRFPEFSVLPWLRLLRCDVCMSDSLPTGDEYSHVLHAATDSTSGLLRTPLQRYDQIVTGTRNMLDVAVRSREARFLLTSSGAVYGPQPLGMPAIPEEYLGMPDPLDPGNAYAVGKVSAEHLCALYSQRHGVPVVIARCFAFVGQDLPLDAHFAIGNFIRDALEGDEVTVTGNGSPIRSYLDQRDLAEWLVALLERGQPGRAYNVGSDDGISIRDLAYLVRDTLAPSKPVRLLGTATVSSARQRYVPDISRAQRELGLRVTVPIRQAIRDAADRDPACRPAGVTG